MATQKWPKSDFVSETIKTNSLWCIFVLLTFQLKHTSMKNDNLCADGAGGRGRMREDAFVSQGLCSVFVQTIFVIVERKSLK